MLVTISMSSKREHSMSLSTRQGFNSPAPMVLGPRSAASEKEVPLESLPSCTMRPVLLL